MYQWVVRYWGRQVPSSRQVPSLTLRDTFRPNGCHVLMGRQVPRGCQGPNGRRVPSLTLCDTFFLDGCHVSIGCQVPRGRQVPNDH